jgi:hypothetical protein
MFKRTLCIGVIAVAISLPNLPASAQSDRRSAAEAYARVLSRRNLVKSL